MGSKGVKAEIPEGLPTTPLADKQLRRITNLHMVTKPGHDVWRITQCVGELSGGAPTLVELPVWQIPREKATYHLIELFKGQGRYGKIMDLYENLTKEW